MRVRRLCSAVLVVGMSLGTSPVYAADDAAERGRAYALRHCAVCHAVGATGASPYAAAPPFRILLQRSPLDYLTRTLESGLAADHRAFREMQGFVLSRPETADLVAYWRTLQTQE